jgi:O-antigen/teichoic acid export membrane protein
MWDFSKWLLISGIGNYTTRKADQLIAGRLGDAHSLGIYSIASEIGQLPTAELGPPIMRAFLPTLSTIKDDMNRVHAAVLKTLGAINTIMLATACGFAAVAEPLTLVLLGEKWNAVAPFLAIFAIVGAFKVAVQPFTGLFLLQGHSKLHARMMWAEFLAFVLSAALLAPEFGVMGLAYARLFSVIIYFLINLHATKLHSGIGYANVLNVMWRPIIGAAIMVMTLMFVPLLTADIYLELAQKIVTGVIVYGGFIFLSWNLCGRPDGIEAVFLNHLGLKTN